MASLIRRILLAGLFLWRGSEGGGRELSLLHAIWRHGDRSPALLIPSDTLNPLSSWPQGLGELTQLGMRQHFALGQWIRRHYGSQQGVPLIHANYSAFQIHVQSTSYNRTIMSAMANLAGLYANSSFQASLPWTPVPVHSRPKDEDPLLYEQYPCQLEDDYYLNTVQNLPQVLAIMEKNKNLLDFVRKESGLPLPNLNSMYTVFDPLHCERSHRLEHKWPSWVNDSIYEELSKLHDLSTSYYVPTDYSKKMRGGVLVTDIIERMQSRAEGSLDPRLRYQVYSAHDTTLIVLLSTLGVFNNRNPPYASALFVELWRETAGNFSVSLRYRNWTAEDEGPEAGHVLQIPGCPQPCPLSDFAALYAKFRVEKDEVKWQCMWGGSFIRALSRLSLEWWLGIVVFQCGLLLILAVFVIALIQERKGSNFVVKAKSGPKYRRLPTSAPSDAEPPQEPAQDPEAPSPSNRPV